MKNLGRIICFLLLIINASGCVVKNMSSEYPFSSLDRQEVVQEIESVIPLFTTKQNVVTRINELYGVTSADLKYQNHSKIPVERTIGGETYESTEILECYLWRSSKSVPMGQAEAVFGFFEFSKEEQLLKIRVQVITDAL